MSEVIQQFNVPAKTTVAREIPGSDFWKNDPFLIKFGDFEVQVMDMEMKVRFFKTFLLRNNFSSRSHPRKSRNGNNGARYN